MIKKYKFIIIISIILLILGVYLLITNIRNNNLKKESFILYDYHDFSNNISKINKGDLIDDPYLTSLLRIDNYNGNITKENIDDIMVYYLLNLTKNMATSIIDNENSEFCMSSSDFKKSFKEFFNFDISNSMNLLDTLDYVNYSKNRICFIVDDGIYYDYYTLIGVDYIKSDGKNITARIYLYDIDADSKEEEEYIKNNLITYLNIDNLKPFNNVISTYEEKTIVFREIPKGDFFKYQVLSVLTKKH